VSTTAPAFPGGTSPALTRARLVASQTVPRRRIPRRRHRHHRRTMKMLNHVFHCPNPNSLASTLQTSAARTPTRLRPSTAPRASLRRGSSKRGAGSKVALQMSSVPHHRPLPPMARLGLRSGPSAKKKNAASAATTPSTARPLPTRRRCTLTRSGTRLIGRTPL
jgi:hypothetical protein